MKWIWLLIPVGITAVLLALWWFEVRKTRAHIRNAKRNVDSCIAALEDAHPTPTLQQFRDAARTVRYGLKPRIRRGRNGADCWVCTDGVSSCYADSPAGAYESWSHGWLYKERMPQPRADGFY